MLAAARFIALVAGSALGLVMTPASAVNKLRDRTHGASTIHVTGKLKNPGSSSGTTTYECSKYSDTCLIAVYAAPAAPAASSIDGNDHSNACYTAFEFDATHAPKGTKKFVWVLVDAVADRYTYRFNPVKAVDLIKPDQYMDGNTEDTDRRYFHWHIKQPNASSRYSVNVIQRDKQGNETNCDATDPVIANS